jgi:hypothetical protein
MPTFRGQPRFSRADVFEQGVLMAGFPADLDP